MWKFYGREVELDDLGRILNTGRWSFIKIEGRRRIGKTSLIENLAPKRFHNKTLYFQIPDSSAGGVLARFQEALESFEASQFLDSEILKASKSSLLGMARALEVLLKQGWLILLDEFQYFNRKALFSFNSYLQESIDRIQSQNISGSLIVLGSLHTEMAALLDDKRAPLYARTTHTLYLDHLSPKNVSQILSDHSCLSPERLLFLWTIFEGVPKFYKDAFEQDVLRASREQLLDGMFFKSAAPLKAEASNWFLAELRGKYDMVLGALAKNINCNHGALLDACRIQNASESESQVGSYVKTLIEKYRLVEKQLPIFAKPQSRNARYRISDLFLTAWLGAIRQQSEASHFKANDILVKKSSDLLYTYEGYGLEHLLKRSLYDLSKSGKGDIQLTQSLEGYWDRSELEIDLVGLDDENKIIRFFSCKRNSKKSVADTSLFQQHVERFFQQKESSRFVHWQREMVLVSTLFDSEQRSIALPSNQWRFLDFKDLGLV